MSWQKKGSKGYDIIKEEKALRTVSQAVNYQDQTDYMKMKQL
jgi:hypothetical protein